MFREKQRDVTRSLGRNPTFKLFEQNSACALAPADILSSRGRSFMGENDPVAELGVRPVRRGKGGFDLLLKCSDVLMFLLWLETEGGANDRY